MRKILGRHPFDRADKRAAERILEGGNLPPQGSVDILRRTPGKSTDHDNDPSQSKEPRAGWIHIDNLSRIDSHVARLDAHWQTIAESEDSASRWRRLRVAG
ncbi:hypothetical protein L1277_000372 [Okibacterium sp. HSC-33S16]|uniref:hypothetical protein n=1 Tax=Okibacterium sp. HSC-33S16 TaxID=2910965 RepID=UPI00209E0F08|nr:hypothetical protein [Okibacterium sp. HSC-33S16]MCP2030308.1 hypothetical protein [Okibacterium sp. HSC-33S16]